MSRFSIFDIFPSRPIARWTLSVCCVLLVASAATGQEVDRDKVTGGLSFIDEVKVTVVNIDVFVRDRSGDAITGLTKGDFRLIQDGHERELSHFAAYTEEVIESITAAPSPGSGETPDAPDTETQELQPADREAALAIQPVHIVIYVDNENIRPHDRNRVLSQTRRFISEVMKPHVRVMVVSALRSATIVQPFTDDPREVQDALRSLNQTYGARVDKDIVVERMPARQDPFLGPSRVLTISSDPPENEARKLS